MHHLGTGRLWRNVKCSCVMKKKSVRLSATYLNLRYTSKMSTSFGESKVMDSIMPKWADATKT